MFLNGISSYLKANFELSLPCYLFVETFCLCYFLRFLQLCSQPGQRPHLRPVQALYRASPLQEHGKAAWIPGHCGRAGRAVERCEDADPGEHLGADKDPDEDLEAQLQTGRLLDDIDWDPRQDP